jgi:hypothetical protein
LKLTLSSYGNSHNLRIRAPLLSDYSLALQLMDGSIEESSARLGGAVAIIGQSSVNYPTLKIVEVRFIANYGSKVGGGLYCYQIQGYLSKNSFTANKVSPNGGFGGAIYSESSILYSSSDFFTSNIGTYGSAVSTFEGRNYFQDATLNGNEAFQIGGFYCESREIELEESFFETDNAERAAAQPILLIDGGNFQFNLANISGAVLFSGPNCVANVKDGFFLLNAVNYHGAVFYGHEYSWTKWEGFPMFQGNIAKYGGGGIFYSLRKNYDRSTLLIEPVNNNGVYGLVASSRAIAVKSESEGGLIASYDSPMISLTVSLIDDYNQIIIEDPLIATLDPIMSVGNTSEKLTYRRVSNPGVESQLRNGTIFFDDIFVESIPQDSFHLNVSVGINNMHRIWTLIPVKICK